MCRVLQDDGDGDDEEKTSDTSDAEKFFGRVGGQTPVNPPHFRRCRFGGRKKIRLARDGASDEE